jgi:uncharacterized membrane protein
MESRIKLLGHPLHPILIPFPIGLLVTSLIFDAAGILTGDPTWHQVAYPMIFVGALMGLIAGLVGWYEWFGIPGGTRAKSVGLMHGLGNLVVIAVFALSWLTRTGAPERPGVLPLLLSVLGVALLAVTGWLGGELVDRLAVGVDRGANVDAPSSLSGASIAEVERPRS